MLQLKKLIAENQAKKKLELEQAKSGKTLDVVPQ